MASGTRSSSRKAKADEDNDLKGGQNSGKKSVNSGAATEAASGVRRSPRETPSKKNTTPTSSSGRRKSERLEKQTADLNSMTPPAKKKSEQLEKKKSKKNASPLRRSERVKNPSLSTSSGSKSSDKSPNLLKTKRKKDIEGKSVKQLTMVTVDVNKNELEDEEADETQKKRMDARAYRALFRKQPKRVNGTDRCEDLNGTYSGRRDEDFLEEFIERNHERTAVTSTSQSVEEALKINNEHTLFHTNQEDSCKNMSSNGGDPQISKNGLVAGEIIDDSEKAAQKNLQSPELVESIGPEGVLDCDISAEMVQKAMPFERTGHHIDIVSVASLKMSSNDIGTITGVGTSLSSGCKRKDCTETCGMCSKRQRVDCSSTGQGIFSSNINLNQLSGSSDIEDRGKLDVGSTGHVEKPCNYMQKHISSADLQTICDENICIVCRLDGKLLCCHGKGCQRSYHLSCLEPSLEEFPLGAWYCLVCVRKKLELGIYSVSEGIEAIWDSRELEASEDGLQRQKQYFVKYTGLAHVHNLWVPESQVLLEAPSLVAKYNRRKQGAVWKQQWAVPHRLLQKRLLPTSKECDEHHNKEHDVDKLNCHAEWLVKWCGLGYEYASWELENASFFNCPEGRRLIQEYETRKKAQGASKFDKERAVASLRISQSPAADSSGLEANLDAVNKLFNYWRSGQNAVIFDGQERILNVIASILGFPSDISGPFLIISTPTSLYSWDEEFLRLAPSADIVVYGGSKEIRNSIRNLEFYDEGGCIMFQALITSPEVLTEDLDMLDCIGWEAIIVDECQRPRIVSCFEQIKMLTARKRLLIISSQLKDNLAEYRNFLSLLDSQSNSNTSESLVTNLSDNVGTLKERLTKYVAYECKLESTRFLEYWVPVLLSNVQLEKYCFTLLSNSLSLCSPSKGDPFGVLRDILISSRKCCDHPYDVDHSLQMLLTKGLQAVEILDVGIKASAKLQLLDAMLWEIKKRELKVLILFQYIGGSGRDLMGDILDDFLRQRFGIDSYERVDNGVIPSKKQSALNRFNNERERFVFLLETRARLHGIKLSAVGAVIIFGSDWSPMNDIRALQRITLDSQFEQIKVFRLYSSFTVEEKLLILSKQDKTIDSNIKNISPSGSHMLLKWGASYLFSQLDKFHCSTTPDACTLSEQSHLLKDVIQEFLTILDQTGIDDDASKLSLILQAKQNQGTYRTEMPLFGEQKIKVMNEDPPHTFWTKLLEGKRPRWKYFTSSSQRNRKRVQYFDDLPKQTEAESGEVATRRKKFVSDDKDQPSPKYVLQEGKLAAGELEGRPGTSSDGFTPLSKSVDSRSDKIHTTSDSLHLANNISKIPALNMVEWESRRKQRDSQKHLHVLLRPQLAKLCEVLHLTEDVKAMVERFLEYIMNNHLVNREPETILQAFQISLCWSAASLLKQKLDHKESLALAMQHLGFSCKKEEADYVYSMLRCLKRMFLYRTGYLKVPNSPKASGLSPEIQLAQRDLLKSVKEIEKKCDKLMGKLVEKHKEEREQFNQKYEEEKAQLENMKRTEAAVIRLHSNVSMRTDKLKNLDIEYERKFDELKQQMDLDLKNLEALQVAARSNIQERRARWVESVKSWARVELVKPPVSHQISDGSKVNMSDHETVSLTGALENLAAVEAPSCEEIPNRASLRMPNREVPLKGAPSSEQFSDLNTIRKVDGQVPLRETVVANSDDGRENLVSAEAPETVCSGEGYEDLPVSVVPSSERDPGRTTLNVPDGELAVGRPEVISSTEGQGNVMSTNGTFEKQIPGGATLNVHNEEIPKSTSEIATSCDDVMVCTNPCTSKEPETAPSEALGGGRGQRENDGASPMENDQQGGVLCTLNREFEFQELALPDISSVQSVPTLDKGGPPPPDLVSPNVDSLPYASSEMQARYTANNEMRNASQVDETSPFNGTIDVTCYVSNADATVMGLREQAQQLRSSESTSNLSPPDLPSVSAIDHQSNNECQTANQSFQAPGQPVANHFELSNQDVLQPLHLPIDGAVDGLVRQASETMTASVPSVSNGLPLHTAPTVSSRMPLYHDPLQNEMERILKEKEQTTKAHEDAKVQLKLECEKEMEEVLVQLRRKYQVKLKEKETEFLLRRKELDINYNKVLLNKILAGAFRCKCMDNRASVSTGAKQEANSRFMQQLVQVSSQQTVQQASTASGLPSTGSASSMQTVSPLQPSIPSGIPSTGSATSTQPISPFVSAQTMGPPLQGVTTALFSGTPTRPPQISTISSSTGNHQIGTEIRAPAPHLQPFRPSSSIFPSSLPLHSHGMSSQQAHNNHHGVSMSLPQSYVNPLARKEASTTDQPARIQHEIAGGSTAPPNSSLPSLDDLMGVNDVNANPPTILLSDVSSRLATVSHQECHVSSSRPNSAQQSGGATDIVCLSDDD